MSVQRKDSTVTHLEWENTAANYTVHHKLYYADYS